MFKKALGLTISLALASALPAQPQKRMAFQARWTAARMLQELFGPLMPQILQPIAAATAAATVAPPTLIASTCGPASGTGYRLPTAPINTTGATGLIMFEIQSNGPSFSDSYSNTWTTAGSYNNGGQYIAAGYVQNPVVGPGHTFTGSDYYPGQCVVAFSNADVSTFFESGTFIGGTTSPGTTLTLPSVTPTFSGNNIVVSAASCGGNCNFPGTTILSANSGIMTPASIAPASGVTYGLTLGYLIQSGTAAVTPTWSVSGTAASNAVTGVIAVFKGAH